MLIFRESLKYPDVDPFIILDKNRNDYIEGLKEFREENKVDKLVVLMKKEATEYFNQCKYFM